jgi:hypothetical protein
MVEMNYRDSRAQIDDRAYEWSPRSRKAIKRRRKTEEYLLLPYAIVT